MALITADRVKEITRTTGTGSFSLEGTSTGYRAFENVCANNDTCYYCVVSQSGSEWEIGLGTFKTVNTLERTTVHSSSNAGALVNFPAGTKDIFLAITATQFSGGTLPSQTGNSGKFLTTNGATASWSDNPLGTVTSVGGTGTVNGLSLSGTVTSSGNLTLGGALSGVNLISQVTGTLPVANGGTGTTTAQLAINALAGAVTSGSYLRGNGTNVVMATISAGDVPTLNQNTTGTAANVTGTVAVANGGTGTTDGSITGTGALSFTAGGTNQGVTISPSGTGSVTIDNVPIGDGVSGSKFNIGIGGGNFVSHVSGNGSVAIGYASLNKLTTGIANTAIGAGSGIEITSGQYNSACGYYAIPSLTTGSTNYGGGAYAGQNLTSGNYNTLVGSFSLSRNGTGSSNVGLGYSSATFQEDGSTALTSASNSVYIGAYCRGFSNSDDNSIVIGYQAIGKGANTAVIGNSNTTQTWLGGGEVRLPGSTSGYVGLKGAATAGSTTYTLPSADGTSGQYLKTNGSGTMSWATVTSNPGTVTSVGGTGTVNGITLTGTVTSSGNLTLGGTLSGVSLTSQVTGTLPVANGGTGQTTAANAINALLPTQTSNSGKFLTTNGTASSWATVVASPAGNNSEFQYNSSGSFAGASKIKYQSSGWPSVVDASENASIGFQALNSVTTGGANTAFGTLSLSFLTSGSGNCAIGAGSGYSLTTGIGNTAIGKLSLFSALNSQSNVAVGSGALYNTTSAGSAYNVGVGTGAGYNNTTGYGNTFIGGDSGQANTTGYNNTYIGNYAGYNGSPTTASGQNNTTLGYYAVPTTWTVNDQITLGNSSISTLRCQVTSITSLSDQRDKTNIQPMPSVLSFIASLNPVQFDWWTRDGAKIGVQDYGFIAQELQQAQASNGFDWAQLVYEDNPEKLEASPGKLIPILVKAIQELAAKVAALEAAV